MFDTQPYLFYEPNPCLARGYRLQRFSEKKNVMGDNCGNLNILVIALSQQQLLQ